VHKLRNLELHARHALEEVKSDYHRIGYAEALDQAKKTYREFISKWNKLAPKVVVSWRKREMSY
jgi:transposase-like protein